MRYLVPALNDLGDLLKGRPVAPVELYDAQEALTAPGVSAGTTELPQSVTDPELGRERIRKFHVETALPADPSLAQPPSPSASRRTWT